MNNQTLPVSIQTMIIEKQGINILYPQVVGMENLYVQSSINQTIYDAMHFLMQQQYKEQDVQGFIEVTGAYEIKTNERNILSLSLSNYAYAPQHAHGLTLMKSLTFDVETGQQYELAELFKPNSNYVEVLSKQVQKQIQERDIQLINGFMQISSNQDYYIADKSLVLYFQLYEITPHYVGLPMFPISVFVLEDIIDENGPLGRLVTNS